MVANPLLHHILSDERLTGGLGDAEARVLVEWLVEQAEELMELASAEEAKTAVDWLCRRGRAVARFVRLWCLERARGAAGQLAAAERFAWPLPPRRRRCVRADARPSSPGRAISFGSDAERPPPRKSFAALPSGRGETKVEKNVKIHRIVPCQTTAKRIW